MVLDAGALLASPDFANTGTGQGPLGAMLRRKRALEVVKEREDPRSMSAIPAWRKGPLALVAREVLRFNMESELREFTNSRPTGAG